MNASKRKPSQHLPTYWVSTLLLCIGLVSSCTEPQMGCLDIASTNFSASADEPCESCCVFPKLQLDILHRITQADTLLRIQYDSLYRIGNEQPIVFQNIQLLLSDFAFLRADGTRAEVVDTLRLAIPTQSGDTLYKVRLDNFVTSNAADFQTNTIANYSESGNFVGIQFHVGVIEPDNQAIPTSLADDHPLRTDNLYLGTGLGYIFNQITYKRDTAQQAASNTIAISGAPFLQQIQLDTNVVLQESRDIRVVLAVDYAEWFADVNLETDSPALIAEKITANLGRSFSVFSISN